MKKLITTLIIAGSLFSGTTHAAQSQKSTAWQASFSLTPTQGNAPTTTQSAEHQTRVAVHETGILGAQAAAFVYLATSKYTEEYRNAFYALAKDNPAYALLGASAACLIVKSTLDVVNAKLAKATTYIQENTHEIIKNNMKLALGLVIGGLIFKPFLTNSK